MKNDSILLTENLARYKGDLVHLRKLNESSSSSRGEFDIKGKTINVLETVILVKIIIKVPLYSNEKSEFRGLCRKEM